MSAPTAPRITPAYTVMCGTQPVVCDTMDEALAAWQAYLQTNPRAPYARGSGIVTQQHHLVASFHVSAAWL